MKANSLRLVEINDMVEAARAVEEIGATIEDIKEAAEGLCHRIIKISNIDSRSANLLKQQVLSVGAKMIIPDDIVLLKASRSDVLLSGTIIDYERLYKTLLKMPFDLPEIGEDIKHLLECYDNRLGLVKARNYKLDFNEKTLVMGILNITPDSFSDGGKYDTVEQAVDRAKKMVKEGADIIDIGAESSRPGADFVSEEEELKRLSPILEALVRELDVPISIDTYKAEVARQALEKGASIINDITGLKGDTKMAEVVSDYDAAVVIMHMQGNPQNMQNNPVYDDVVNDIILELEESVKIAKIAGITSNKIIVDPGIGFGKTHENNLEIIRKIKEFKSLGFPVLVGASRKSVVGNVLGTKADDRLEGSLAIAAITANNGANILRVHDVKETKRVLQMIDAVNIQNRNK